MPKLVEVPDVGEVEFPDEMNDDQIVQAIRGFSARPEEPSVSSVPAPESTGLGLNLLDAEHPPFNAYDDPEAGAKMAQAVAELDVSTRLRQEEEQRASEAERKANEDILSERERAFGVKFRPPEKPSSLAAAVGGAATEGTLHAVAGAMEGVGGLFESDAIARNPKDQPRLNQIRARLKTLEEETKDVRPMQRLSEDMIGKVSERDYWRKEAATLARTPRAETAAGKVAAMAERAGEIARGVPGAKGSIGRGVGNIAAFAPTLTLGGVPAIAAGTAQAVANASSAARTAKEQELRAEGITDPGTVDILSRAAGNKEALKTMAATPAYLIPGFATARMVGRATQQSPRVIQALAQTGGAAATNILTGATIRDIQGETPAPTLEQAVTDIGFGAVQGISEFVRPSKPNIEQPPVRGLTELGDQNAQQIRSPSPPDGGVRAPEIAREDVTLPAPKSGEGVQPSRQREGMVEPAPEAASPQGIVPAIRLEGEVVRGEPGESHRQLFDRATKDFDDLRKIEANEEFDHPKRNPNFFVDETGKEYSRDQLEQQFGVRDSQRLAELQQQTERKLGPGAANIEEPFTSPEPVGAWNAKVDEQRAARGLEPLASEARKADQTTWDNAEQRFTENPNYGRDLVDSINAGKRESVSDTEQAAILREMLSLREQRDQATTRAFDEATYSPEERAVFLEEAKAADERLEKTEEADRKSGTAQGRALRIRRLMAYEDFTLAGLMGKARRAKGEELTPAETENIKSKADRFQKAKEKFEAKVDEAEVGQPIDEAIRQIEAEAAKDPEFAPEVRSLADRIVARLERAANSARSRLRGLMSQLGSAPDVSKAPALIKELAIIAASDITRGAVKFGQWATKMVKEFGEKVKPYLTDAWKQADQNIDAQVTGTRTKKPKEVKAAVTKENVGAAVEQLGTAMKAKGGKLSEMRSDIQKLVETLVRGGIKTREPLVDAVHEVLKGIDPSITRRQTMDAISGYGDFKQLNKDAVKAEVRDLKQQLQLAAKIEDVLGSVPLKRSGIERQPLSDEGRALTKKLNELSRELGIKVTDPATQLKSILGALETRLTNRIKDLKSEIAKGQRTVKTKTPTPTNAKIEGLRAELEQVQAQHEAVFGKQTRKMTDEQKIRIYKTRTQNRIKELETRIKNEDFGPRPKRTPLDVSKDPEAVKAKAEMERVKKEFQQKQFEWQQAQRTRTQKFIDGVKEGLGASRSIITSADVSAPFRQGGFLLMGDLVFHPVRAAKQIGTMLKQLVSEKAFEEAQAKISLRPNARSGLYDQSGLYLSDLSTKLSAREENMRSNLAERIPIIGRIVRASNRAYSGFLNRQRADTFDAMVESMGGPSKLTPDEAKAIANFVNTATGRGTVAQLERAADVMARYFFSPRFLASRFQLALGQPLGSRTGSLRVKREAAKQYGKFAVGLAAIYGLAKLAGGDLEKDPRSADFGKAKFGNTRIDPLAGLAQVTTFLAREITGETKKKGRIEEKNRLDTFGRFVRTKLAPIPGVIADRMAEQRLDMSKPTPYRKAPLTALGEDAARLGVPLSYQEAPQVYKEHGFVRGTILEVLNLLGAGVQSYDKR